jgi:hypothetical protein
MVVQHTVSHTADITLRRLIVYHREGLMRLLTVNGQHFEPIFHSSARLLSCRYLGAGVEGEALWFP